MSTYIEEIVVDESTGKTVTIEADTREELDRLADEVLGVTEAEQL